LTKINKPPIAPNAPYDLTVKVRAKLAVSPPVILFSQISEIQTVDLDLAEGLTILMYNFRILYVNNMQKKLKIAINEELIEFAHEFSKKTGQSISHIIEQYLQALKTQEEKSGLTDKTLSLYGIFVDSPIPSKKELRTHFHEDVIRKKYPCLE